MPQTQLGFAFHCTVYITGPKMCLEKPHQKYCISIQVTAAIELCYLLMQFVVKYCANVQCFVFMLFLYNKPTFNMLI